MNPNDWVMSLDNPTRAKYEAHKLWKQGLRSGDRIAIQAVYGYTDHEMDCLCYWLDAFYAKVKDFNPEIGF